MPAIRAKVIRGKKPKSRTDDRAGSEDPPKPDSSTVEDSPKPDDPTTERPTIEEDAPEVRPEVRPEIPDLIDPTSGPASKPDKKPARGKIDPADTLDPFRRKQ